MINLAFVCMGNTCRSPIAECVTKDLLKQKKITDIKVSSFGLVAKNGEPINPLAYQVLKNYKIRHKTHKAKKLTDNLAKKQDYIFVMTDQLKNILKKYPNVYTIKEFVDGMDIPDPYGLGYDEYEAVFKIIYTSCKKILEKLEMEK